MREAIEGVGRANLEADAQTLYDVHRETIHRRTDRLFGWLLVFQWVFAIVLAAVTPARSIQLQVWAAVLGGGLIVTLPAAMTVLKPGRAITRHLVAAAQMLLSSLLIHLSGGRIETHFHVFGSLAFLAFYRDWRVLITASSIVAADHVLRGVIWPESAYGNFRWLEYAGWVVFEDIVLILACLRGVDEMKAIALRQAELQAANHAVHEASRAKSDFLANMSHEIRTPMTAILGCADMLLKPGRSPSDVLSCVQTIRRNSQHLLLLINDVLDLSKIEAGKMAVERIKCSPGALLAEVASLMRVPAAEKGLAFDVECQTPLPAEMLSDPTRLKQVLINLIGNAIKFTARGSVRVVCRLDRDGPRPLLKIDVLDTGIGMTDEQVGRLFQPFVQADGSMSRRFGGTGLGLTISRYFVEQLGGSISVQSVPDVGSRFSITLDPGALDGVAMVEGMPSLGNTPWPFEDVVRLVGRVLIAEDGPDNQLLLRLYMNEAGIDATIVGDGKQACELIAAEQQAGRRFDLVLMDMQMPVLDGYAATSALRRGGFRGPIIALTAHAMVGDREKCLNAGCDDYVVKPINPAELFAAMRRFLPVAVDTPPAGPEPELVSRLADDPRLEKVVQTFVNALPDRMAALQAAMSAEDREAVKTLSHQLKGAAGGFGFDSISAAASAVEHASDTEAIADVRRQIDQLAALCRRAERRSGGRALLPATA